MHYLMVSRFAANAGMRSSFISGKIPFQSEGVEIYFRKIKLVALAPQAKWQLTFPRRLACQSAVAGFRSG